MTVRSARWRTGRRRGRKMSEGKAPDRRKQDNRPGPAGQSGGAVDAFLREAGSLAPVAAGADQGRLIFALDATMSRQPTWIWPARSRRECSTRRRDRRARRTTRLFPRLSRMAGTPRAGGGGAWVSDPRALTEIITGLPLSGWSDADRTRAAPCPQGGAGAPYRRLHLRRRRHGGTCRYAVRPHR